MIIHLFFSQGDKYSKPKCRYVNLSWVDKKKVCDVHNTHPCLTHEEVMKYMVDHHDSKVSNHSII
jgi:hypothetical protein